MFLKLIIILLIIGAGIIVEFIKNQKGKRTAIILSLWGIALLFVVFGYKTEANKQQAEANKQQEVNKLQLADTTGIPKNNDENTIKGTFTTDKLRDTLENNTIRIKGNIFPIIDSYKQDPPFTNEVGLWQGVLDVSREKQLFFVAHQGYLSGNSIMSLEPNDIVDVCDKNGLQQAYRVSEIKLMDREGNDPADPSVNYYEETINSQENRILLQTCRNNQVIMIAYAYPI